MLSWIRSFLNRRRQRRLLRANPPDLPPHLMRDIGLTPPPQRPHPHFHPPF
ncbi:hypothetical protein SAMN05216200_1206 [Oceanicella actignis]|uniref:DUF1127 domain-containing protein n=1 Tax=Oceanicella actignis TaxID=1189325 RepID=A0A1M7U5A0_9RHOB|nr:hypothetical protein SAMN04488119_1196 [Oceanicella actignis]SHN78057.1 hypothetical protein SAMN05216200_1206 [Oceanicella actignis]